MHRQRFPVPLFGVWRGSLPSIRVSPSSARPERAEAEETADLYQLEGKPCPFCKNWGVRGGPGFSLHFVSWSRHLSYRLTYFHLL